MTLGSKFEVPDNTRFCEELEFTTKNRKIGGNEFSTISCRQKKIYIFMNVSKTQQTRIDFQEIMILN